MKIHFKLFDLAIDKIKEPIAYFIDLQPDYFTFWLEAIYDHVPLVDEVDEDELDLNGEPRIVEDEYMFEARTYKRELIEGLEIDESFKNDIQVYVVAVNIKNSPVQIIINFQTKKEALKFYKQMIEYMCPTKNETKSIHNNI